MSQRIFFIVMFFVLLASISVLAFNIQPAKAQGTIYIRADGSIDPGGVPIMTTDNITYTLTNNINDSIVVERNSIVLNGAGFTLFRINQYAPMVDFSGRTNVTIENMQIRGDGQPGEASIKSHYGSNNSVIGNTLTDAYGIDIRYSTNDDIVENTLTGKNNYGIYLLSSSDNTIVGNNITENHGYVGIMFEGPCTRNNASFNNMKDNSGGINFAGGGPTNNTVIGNNITRNFYGIVLVDTYDNTIFHNNFEENNVQVGIDYSWGNVWDDGYPSGGNRWSDYNGTDVYSGSYQNETGSDGIGDTPHVLDENNTDHYPVAFHNLVVLSLVPYKTIVGKGYPMQIKATVANLGCYTETSNVTGYANSTVMSTIINITLTSKNSTPLGYAWNTTGFVYGNYTGSAYVECVSNETDISDNIRTADVEIHVGVAGDVSSSTPGVYDKKCDMKDIAYLVTLFNTKPTSPNWNPNADVNNDGTTNMKDIAIAVLNFNQHE